MKTFNYFDAKRRVSKNYLGIYGIDDLNRFLNLKRNELKMLEKTYDEACEKKGGKPASILYEIERLKEEIKIIEEDVMNLKSQPSDEDVIVESKPIKRRRRCKIRPEVLEEQSLNGKMLNVINAQNYNNDLFDDGKETLEFKKGKSAWMNDRLATNQFLVSFSEDLPVSEMLIKGVEFLDDGLQVSIWDHMVNDNGDKRSLIEVLEHLKENGTNIAVTLKRVNGLGVTFYEEQYPICKIGHIFRTPFDYNNEDVSYISVNFQRQVPKVYKYPKIYLSDED